MNHIVSSQQLNLEMMNKLFQLTDEIILNPLKYNRVLDNKTVATIFYEPSTRTRLSFESAVQRLGGNIISTENANEMSSAIKGENLQDTIRVIEGYCDAIILRHYNARAAQEAVEVANVPIINAGGGDGEHPTQALLDMYTVRKYKGKLNALSFALVGDLKYGRTIHSLVKLLSLFNNITVYGVSRNERKLPNLYKEYLKRNNVTYIESAEILNVPKDVDVIYQTRTQTERAPRGEYELNDLSINKYTLEKFSNETILMHPLPRNSEISNEVDSDPRAVYFNQSKNGMYVRMALLTMIFTQTTKLGG